MSINHPDQRGIEISMAEVTAAAEYKDDVTIAKERTGKEEQSTSKQVHFQVEVGSGETAANKTLLAESDAQRESAEESVRLSSSDDDGRQSPVPSVISMKSDQSKTCPIAFTGETSTETSCSHHGRQSPVSSVISMKSDQSMSSIAFAGDSTKNARKEGCVLCSICPKAASKSCLTCIASFCEMHARQHYTAPALQRHKLVEATADLEERLCQQHYRVLEFFCETDQTAVCALCAIKEHPGHEIMEHGEHRSLQSNRSQITSQRGQPPPGPIKFTSVNPDSVSLSWGVPEGLTEHHRFRVTWRCEGEPNSVVVSNHRFTVDELIPGKKYDFSVATLMDDDSQSVCVFATARTEIPKPDNVTITSDLTSLLVEWTKPAGVDEVNYLLSLHSGEECLDTRCLMSLQRCFSGLQIGKEYSISVSTVLKKGGQSQAITKTIWTDVPVPEQLSVDSVTATTANISWSLSHTMDQNPHSFMISNHSKEAEAQTISSNSCSTVITGLIPATEYIVSIFTKTQHGGQSRPSTMTIHTAMPIPENIKVVSATPTSAHVTWSSPQGMEQVSYSYQISYDGGREPQIISKDLCRAEITGLTPCTNYNVRICIELENGKMCDPFRIEICTAMPIPGNIKVVSATPTSAHVTWSPPQGMEQISYSYQISYDAVPETQIISKDLCHANITGLRPCTHYNVSICIELENGKMCDPVRIEICTAMPIPDNIKVVSSTPTSAHVTWNPPQGMEQVSYSYQISYDGAPEPQTISKDSCRTVIAGLRPYTKYNLSICIELEDGKLCDPVRKEFCTAVPAPEQLKVTSEMPTSARLTWSPPQGMEKTQLCYQISYSCEGTELIYSDSCCTIPGKCEAEITGLQPCTDYSFSVCTETKDKEISEPVKEKVHTAMPLAKNITGASVTPTSVHLTWSPPQGMDQTALSYQISYNNGGPESEPICTDECRTSIRGLKPCTDYNFSIRVNLVGRKMYDPVKKIIRTAVPAPKHLEVRQVTPTSVTLTWSFPQGMEQIPHFYVISYHSGGTQSVTSADCSTIIQGLKPCTDYSVSVCTKVNDVEMSEAGQVNVHTAVPAPEQLKVTSEMPTSARLTWSPPQGMDKTQLCYQISYSCEGTEPIYSDSCCTIPGKCEAEITGLQPCTDYSFSVCTKTKDKEISEPVKETVHTAMPLAKNITGASVTPTSVHLTWSPPQGMDQTALSYQISYNNGGPESEPICTDECRASIRGLKPCTDYNFSIRVNLVGRKMYDPVKKIIRTAIPAPEQLRLESVTTTSAELTWSPPQGMEHTPYYYLSTYYSTESKPSTTSSDSQQNKASITGLKPYTKYTVTITTKLQDGEMSEVIGKVFRTAVPVPENIKVHSVTPTSVTLKWHRPQGMKQIPLSYQISCIDGPKQHCTDKCEAKITGLKPGSKYSVSIRTKITDEDKSEAVEQDVYTVVPVPEQLTVDLVTATSVHLTWSKPNVMEQTPVFYQISYYSGVLEPQTISTESCSADITDLQPDTKYKVSICTKFNDRESVAITKDVHTEILTRKLYTIVIGNTQNHHQPLKRRLANRNLTEVKDVKSCDVILAFCVIVSRVGTDMEAALKQIPDSKPVVLTVMHHTFDPDHVTPNTSRFVRGRDITVVNILFHEDKGILRCPRNTEAEQKIQNIIWTCPESKIPIIGSPTRGKINQSPTKEALLSPATSHKETGAPKTASSDSVRNQRGTMTDSNLGHIGLRENPKTSNSSSASSKEVTYCVVLTGNTLGSHKDFQKRLAERVVLPNEVNQSSVAECSFLMVFCPVVSSVGVDVEKALKHIPDDKSSILVVMHHTFSPDFLPPESRGYSRNSNILVVDCLFYEDTGILRCQRNDEAFAKITKWIIGKAISKFEQKQPEVTNFYWRIFFTFAVVTLLIILYVSVHSSSHRFPTSKTCMGRIL